MRGNDIQFKTVCKGKESDRMLVGCKLKFEARKVLRCGGGWPRNDARMRRCFWVASVEREGTNTILQYLQHSWSRDSKSSEQ